MKGKGLGTSIKIIINETSYLGDRVWAKIENVGEPRDGRREVSFYLKCEGKERYLAVSVPARLRNFALALGLGTFWYCPVLLAPAKQLFLAKPALKRSD